jgi:hypothetical protein
MGDLNPLTNTTQPSMTFRDFEKTRLANKQYAKDLLASLAAQRHHRIDSRRPPCREKAG